MADIQLSAELTNSGWSVNVQVHENGTETRHQVSVPKKDYEALTDGKVAVGELVKASFEFLLEHEPKEAILSAFDIMTIARYFPNYSDAIRQRLGI